MFGQELSIVLLSYLWLSSGILSFLCWYGTTNVQTFHYSWHSRDFSCVSVQLFYGWKLQTKHISWPWAEIFFVCCMFWGQEWAVELKITYLLVNIDSVLCFIELVVFTSHCFVSNCSCPVDGAIVLTDYNLLHYNIILKRLSVCAGVCMLSYKQVCVYSFICRLCSHQHLQPWVNW